MKKIISEQGKFIISFLGALLIIASLTASEARAAAPAAPTNLIAQTVSARQINLSWRDDATNEKKYYVERGTASGGPFTQIASLGANITSYSDAGLPQNTTYYYRVRCKSNTYSNYSNTANAMTATLAAPTGLTAGVISASSISLAWTDNTAYESNYSVERSPNGSSSWTVIATLGANVTTYTNTGLTVGTAYYYRVQAYDGTNYSAYSAVLNQTIRTITASAGANGVISPSGTMGVANGSTRVFTMTPNAGYMIAAVTVDGGAVATNPTYTFSNITVNHTISATFLLSTFTITASAGTNGSISPSGSVVVNGGANQTFTITPTTGYHVSDVLVDGTSVGAVGSYTFTNVAANHIMTASFAINTYSITASAGANGTISPSGIASINSGATTTFTMTSNSGYHVSDVLVDGVSQGSITSYPFSNVTANHTITVNFEINTYTITTSAGANGTISPTGVFSINSGATTTFTMIPNSGYHVSDVLVDGVSQGSITSYPFSNVTANHTITASFEINTYTITTSAGANGTISPSGIVSVNSGATATFTITPTTGYHVSDVLVDGASVGAVSVYTFTNVQAPRTITASFAVNTYTVTPSVTGGNGSIAPSVLQVVSYGSSTTFTITPTTGYHVSDVLVDGASVGAVSAYPFTNVTANHTIAASFAADDTTPPVVTITSPVAGNTNNTTPTLTYTVSDGTVVVKVDGIAVNKVSGNNLDILSFATHTVRVESTDAANNTGYAEMSFTVGDPSLIGLWHMDGDWADASGNGNNGTASNGATFSTSARVGSQAGSFDGVNDYVSAGSGIVSNVSNTFTIAFWVNPTAGRNVTSESNSGISGVSGQRYAVAPQNGGYIDAGAGTDAGVGISVGTNGISVFEHRTNYLPSLLVYNATLSGWNHVAVVYQNKQPKLYVNGQLVRSGLTSQLANVHPSTLFGNISTFGPYQGLLDEVAIYNRALSEQEIIYAAGAVKVQIISPAGLTNNNTPLLNYTIINGTAKAVKVDGNIVSKVSGDTLDIFSDGTHTVRIEAVNSAGLTGYAETAFTVDTVPPTVSIDPVTSPTSISIQTISGTMSNSSIVTVSADTGVAIGPVSYPTGTTWRCNLTDLTIGPNIITVTATDPATNTATVTATITNNSFAIYNVSASSNLINTALSESSTVFFMLSGLSGSATATLKIIPEKQGTNGTPIYQQSQVCPSSGAYLFTWDGHDSTGKVVLDEAYLYELVATSGTTTVTYNPGPIYGTGSIGCSRGSYDPYRNEPLTISYSPTQPSRVLITANKGNQVFTIMDSVPHAAGAYAFDWDGRDSVGTVLDSVAVFCVETALLRGNHIITKGDTPKISLLKTDPYQVGLSYGQFTRITYTLSRDATVTVKLISPSRAAVTLLNSQLQTAGPQALDWNGINASDSTGKGTVISEEGDYMVWIQAVNPSTGSSSVARGSLRIGL